LYVFTLNGFPYGTFHGARVKEEVYLPDWRDPERLRYTNELANLLVQLLPDGMEGSISTVPGAFKPAIGGGDDVPRIAENFLRHVAFLIKLKARSGRHIALAIEPEPFCMLETVDECVTFFEEHIFSPQAVCSIREWTGLGATAAADALRAHVGLCLDLCHAAVEFEDAQDCLRRLDAAGIRVTKLQISAGLRLAQVSAESLQALKQYDDPVYLHQVVQKSGGILRRFADLPEAMATVNGVQQAREWRVHFHVPIFLDDLGAFSSTRFFIREVLAIHRQRPISEHLEVETYTWGVLPETLRAGGIEKAIARELSWVREELGA
jgi:hypothetical protein